MNKRQRTADLKRQLSLAEDIEIVAEQNHKVAKQNVARLRAALSAEETTERKAKRQILSNEDLLRIEASI